MLTIVDGGGNDVIAGLDYFGTLRGRLGVDMDGILPYVTAGLAYGRGYINDTEADLDRDTNFRLGWTAGAVVEVAASDSVSILAFRHIQRLDSVAQQMPEFASIRSSSARTSTSRPIDPSCTRLSGRMRLGSRRASFALANRIQREAQLHSTLRNPVDAEAYS